MTTVRQDLEAALKTGQLAATSFNGMLSHKIPDEEIIGALDSLLDSFAAATDIALARARTEPEESICTAACDQPSEAHCLDCGCYQAGYQEGLEAQRERVG